MGKPKQQSTTSEANPWGPAQGDLKDILAKAKEEWEKNGGLDGNWIDKNFPDLTPEMKQALGNLSQSGKLGEVADQLGVMAAGGKDNIDSAAGALGNLATGGITGEDVNDLAGKLYDSETVKSQQEQLAKDVNHNYDQQVNQLNQQAGGSGNMGSSRAGVAQGVMAGKASDAISKGSADIDNASRSQAYGQALGVLQGNQNTNLNAAGALGNLGMGQGNLANQSGNWYQQMMQNGLLGSQIGQQWQDGKAANDWFNQQGKANAGWDNLGKWLGMTGAIGGMGGSQTNTQSGGGGGWFNQMLGAASTGAGIMGSMGWSDASMKKNVKKVGKSKKGDTIYKWDWNDSAKEQGMKGKGKGVLAQQIAKDKPEAVKQDAKSGRLMVDYDKTDVKPSNTKKGKKGE
ncbi:DNA injection protein [Aeromonas phage BUCT695]|uniref:DNA injection protein n=1 Tax=Aeromonas phage BUCT695 TaxID=2908630 RepID=UPI0023291B41|nr:DNA injection protein [Aeromonas phage BUCT695]UIW10587.1 DNA injection protein [Aeromonas phage BUCT695]